MIGFFWQYANITVKGFYIIVINFSMHVKDRFFV